MKKIFINTLCFLMFIVATNSVKLFSQNSDSTKKRIKEHNNFLSLSLVTSPLFHIFNYKEGKDIFSLPSGLLFSYKFRKQIGKGPGITFGFLFDEKKYFVSYSDSWADSNQYHYIEGKFHYNYLYMPILFNYYLNNFYFSIGGILRKPVFVSGKNADINYIENPKGGIQLGFGSIIPINKHCLDLLVEQYFNITVGGKEFDNRWTYVTETKSWGILTGIYIKLEYKMIKF
jgi:hypothetical protein